MGSDSFLFDPHQGDPSALNALCDISIGCCCQLTVRQRGGNAPVQTQRESVILRHDTQKWQTGFINGVINRGVELAEHSLPYPVYHQMQGAGGEPLQFHDRVLGVPQGGGVSSGDYHAAVRTTGGQQEAGAETGGGIQQAEVISFSDLPKKVDHLPGCHRAAPGAGGCCQQEEAWEIRMLYYGGSQ